MLIKFSKTIELRTNLTQSAHVHRIVDKVEVVGGNISCNRLLERFSSAAGHPVQGVGQHLGKISSAALGAISQLLTFF